MTASPESCFEILNKKQSDFICPRLDFVSLTLNESSIMKEQLLIIKVIISGNDCFSRTDFILSLFRSCAFIAKKGNWWLKSRSGGANVNKMFG